MCLQLQACLQSLGRKDSGIQQDTLTGIIMHDYSKKNHAANEVLMLQIGIHLL